MWLVSRKKLSLKTKQQEAVLKALLKKAANKSPQDALRESLFESQLAFVSDVSKFKTAVCSRRAGKTHAACTKLELGALANPNTSGLYTALTRQSAKRIAWKVFKQHDRQYKLGAKFNNTDLTIEYPNGSDIRLMGINDPDAAEAIRGEKLFGAVLDEAQAYGPHLEYVMEEIITPCLIDLDGWMALIGTPNAACTGPFFAATEQANKEYSQHHWTLLNNPHIPHASKWLASYRKKKGWSEDNPIYMREWRGIWVRSANSLVYQYAENRNCATVSLDPKDTNYILGVDLGYEDASAIVVIAYSLSSPTLQVVETFKRTKMLPSELAAEVKRFDEKYKPAAIVADTGGLGKAIVEEMRKRYGLTIRAAEKRNKFEYVELINSDFVEGKIKIAPHLKELRDELSLLQWDEDRKKEDSRYENHLCDALLYAWRECGHWGWRAVHDAPKYGTEAWSLQHEKEVEDKLVNAEKLSWWEK
jgi:hypothetical protein